MAGNEPDVDALLQQILQSGEEFEPEEALFHPGTAAFGGLGPVDREKVLTAFSDKRPAGNFVLGKRPSGNFLPGRRSGGNMSVAKRPSGNFLPGQRRASRSLQKRNSAKMAVYFEAKRPTGNFIPKKADEAP